MANWEILKAAVAKVIKTNGNQEITGQVLQSTLNNIISVLGENRTFVGIANTATAPGNPDGKVFYITNTAGTYPNFAGLTVNPGELAILINSEGTWVKLALQVPTTAQINSLSAKVTNLSSQVNNNTAAIGIIKDKVIYKDKDAWSADTIVPKGSIALAGYDTVKIGDGITTFAKLANSLTNISTIELSELSNMFSITSGTQGYDNFVKMLKGEFPMYFRVLTKNKVAGTLLLISDNVPHQFTQVLISHFTIDSLNSDYSEHIDSVITIAHRSFNVASSTLPVERGNWTSWQSISPESSGLEILPFSGATFEDISFETTGYSGVVNTILFDIQNAVFYVATGLKNYIAWTDSSGRYKDSGHYNDGTRAKSGLFFNTQTGLVYESPHISVFDTDAILDITNDNVLLTNTIEKFGNAISELQNKLQILPFDFMDDDHHTYEVSSISANLSGRQIAYNRTSQVFYININGKFYISWVDTSGTHKASSYYNNGRVAKDGLFYCRGFVYKLPNFAQIDTDTIYDIDDDDLLIYTLRNLRDRISKLESRVQLNWDFSHYDIVDTDTADHLYTIKTETKRDDSISDSDNIVLYRYIPKIQSLCHVPGSGQHASSGHRGFRRNTWTKCAKATNLYASKLNNKSLIDLDNIFSIPLYNFLDINGNIFLNSSKHKYNDKTLEQHILEYIRDNYILDNSDEITGTDGSQHWIKLAGIKFRKNKGFDRRKYYLANKTAFQYNRFALARADSNMNLLSELLRFNVVIKQHVTSVGNQQVNHYDLEMKIVPINNKNIIL